MFCSGCYNCMKRRIICDQRKPHCRKCLTKQITCPGYGVRYRFTEPKISHAPTNKSRHVGQAARIRDLHPASSRREKIEWVECYGNLSQKKPTALLATPGESRPRERWDSLDGPEEVEMEKVELNASRESMQGGQGGSTDNPSEVSYRQQQDSVSSFLINLPPLLVHEDTKTRHLLEHCRLCPNY